MRSRTFAALLLAALLAVPALQAQPKELEGYDQLVQEMMAAWEVPGLAVAVVKDGKVIYEKGFGQRNVEQKLPATPDTLFAIASVTKAFTTYVMGTLVDEGRLDWDKPAATWLPGLRLHDHTATELLTPRDMVVHRSGLPRHHHAFYNRTDLSRKELLEILPYLETTQPPRARFQYTNSMYGVAGFLVEQITGRTWEDNVRERIFQPLGMTRSNLSVDDLVKDPDHALPYEVEDGKPRLMRFRRLGALDPAGSINSSVREMAKWAALHLAGGKAGDRQLIGAATLANLHSPQMVVGYTSVQPEISTAVYGMGWFLDTYRGRPRVWHDGSLDGFSSVLTLFPEDRLGIVVLTNAHRTDMLEPLVRHTADRLLGLAAIDWKGEALALRAKGEAVDKEGEDNKEIARKPGTRPAHRLEEYAGEYSHPGYGTVAVALAGDRLEMTYNHLSSPLEHWHYETWTGTKDGDSPTLENQKFLFETDVAGNVSALRVRFEPALPEDIRFAKRPDARLSDPAWLSRFVGEYDLGDQTVSVRLSGNVLTATVPGEPPYRLVPEIGGDFYLEELGFLVRFEEDASALHVLQSGGTLTAKRKR